MFEIMLSSRNKVEEALNVTSSYLGKVGRRGDINSAYVTYTRRNVKVMLNSNVILVAGYQKGLYVYASDDMDGDVTFVPNPYSDTFLQFSAQINADEVWVSDAYGQVFKFNIQTLEFTRYVSKRNNQNHDDVMIPYNGNYIYISSYNYPVNRTSVDHTTASLCTSELKEIKSLYQGVGKYYGGKLVHNDVFYDLTSSYDLNTDIRKTTGSYYQSTSFSYKGNIYYVTGTKFLYNVIKINPVNVTPRETIIYTLDIEPYFTEEYRFPPGNLQINQFSSSGEGIIHLNIHASIGGIDSDALVFQINLE